MYEKLLKACKQFEKHAMFDPQLNDELNNVLKYLQADMSQLGLERVRDYKANVRWQLPTEGSVGYWKITITLLRDKSRAEEVKSYINKSLREGVVQDFAVTVA